MYEIYAYTNGDPARRLLIYRPGTSEYQVTGPKLTREVSKAGSLTFTMTRDHPQYDSLPKMRTVVSVHQDGAETWRGRVLNHDADWLNRRAVYCEGALSFFNDSCITPFVYEGKLAQFLQHLIDAHNAQVQEPMKQFRLGTVSAALGDLVVQFGDGDAYGVGEDYGSTWEIISKLVLKTFGGYAYCTFDSDTGLNVLNYCDEAYEADRQTAQTIEYGQNLLDLKEKTDTNSLMTRIYPVGNKHTVTETKWKWKILWWGEKYTESHEERYGIMDADYSTVNKYLPVGYTCDLEEGYIQNTNSVKKFGVISKIIELDTDSDNATFAAGVQALQQNSAMTTSYTIRAVDLVDAGYDTERLTFASFAHIISAPHSIDAIMLCSKLVEPLDQPAKKEFTFGMSRRTLTDRQVINLGTTNLKETKASSESYIKSLLNNVKSVSKNLKDFSDSVMRSLGDLTAQIDSKVETWFYSYAPSTNNYPASSWDANEKTSHAGDLFFDTLTRYCYRWTGSRWEQIQDQDISAALENAASAKDTADGKRRVFTSTPYPPYDSGDLWAQGTGGELMLCVYGRSSGYYVSSDWKKASKYTDDTVANSALTEAQEAAKTATNFLEFDYSSGLTIGHKNLPGKKVAISNNAVKVISGASMVNITAAGIEITDGSGSCMINSGEITFKGIRNKSVALSWLDDAGEQLTSFDEQTIYHDFSGVSAVLLTFESNKGAGWFASGGGGGATSMVIPVNGRPYSMVYPWNTVHRRTVEVHPDRIVFGKGYERTSTYSQGIAGFFSLHEPLSDGWRTNSAVCIPRELYEFM